MKVLPRSFATTIAASLLLGIAPGVAVAGSSFAGSSSAGQVREAQLMDPKTPTLNGGPGCGVYWPVDFEVCGAIKQRKILRESLHHSHQSKVQDSKKTKRINN